MRHLLCVTDLTTAEIERIFAITADLKSKYSQGIREAILPGRVIGMLFEKPSLRTRVSFEAGMVQLGGGSLFLGQDVGFGSRESMADFSRVLSQYVDGVVIRSKRHETVAEVAQHSTCPVINGLTDYAHPCQALADLYTLRELVGKLNGLTLAYVGDANNVARSLVEGCGRLGMKIIVATPKEYHFSADDVARFQREIPQLDLTLTNDPVAAVKSAVAVYTDVWASMGQETESAKRRKAFAAYQVNAALMKQAPAEAYFMHCLPAHRGEEVTDEVIDSSHSVVVQQASNRLHVQKGILAWLLTARG
ncbi:MAG TPA: ornithine carbamoyltransferase [Pirellulales bacterium]|jgi:ornithine carbamoyltransferase|nr:ornithine carbamoyltransferase [Pirellulales bacterium]